MSIFSKSEVTTILRKTGLRTKTNSFDILLAPKSKEIGRILVITSRKIGNAPKRNKLRRRIKSIFHEANLFNSPYDCIVIAKFDSIYLSFDELKNIIINAFNQNNVNKKDN